MGRSQRNDNFIDKTFTIVADILLKVLPASKQEKQAFFYYRDGMSAQSEGEYAEALENYYEALQLDWHTDSIKYLLHIADNPGHGFRNDGGKEDAYDGISGHKLADLMKQLA